ncbi:MAG: hypothetical protein ACREOF_11160 [Gemmatimonadales bacterium]
MTRWAAASVSAALALGASRLAAQDETRWVEVLSDSAEVISIDAASVTPLGDSVYRAWERSVSRGSGDVRVLARADFDCRLRLTRLVAIALRGYAPVPASEVDREWTEILPGSRYEAELRQVCSIAGSVSR